jgi:hypothetical protein
MQPDANSKRFSENWLDGVLPSTRRLRIYGEMTGDKREVHAACPAEVKMSPKIKSEAEYTSYRNVAYEEGVTCEAD